MTVLGEALSAGQRTSMPRVIGGRYGLSSKEFTPGDGRGGLRRAAAPAPKPRFTVGIVDDVTHLSLPVDPHFRHRTRRRWCQAVFYGLGSDGTVGASKNSVKIIAEDDGHYAQGYFVYDSRKSGSVTTSATCGSAKDADRLDHLPGGRRPTSSPSTSSTCSRRCRPSTSPSRARPC